MPSLGFDFHWNQASRHVQSISTDAEFTPPDNAEEFARSIIATICHASVTPAIGRRAYERCMRALEYGSSARLGFRHPGKADAIDRIWSEREVLFNAYNASADKLAFLATLPWIGPVTKHSVARRLGLHTEQQRRAVA